MSKNKIIITPKGETIFVKQVIYEWYRLWLKAQRKGKLEEIERKIHNNK